MIFYTYKIINLIHGKYYYGRRAYKGCNIKEDVYFGSGKRLASAIKKYGKENFIKVIISCYNNEYDLILAEKALISTQHVESCLCYNIAYGGHGGYTYYKDRKFKHTEESKRNLSLKNKGRHRPDVVERNQKNPSSFIQYWKGKSRSDKDKELKSLAAYENIKKGKHSGTKILKCPYCGLETNLGNSKRWHFNNCKLKPVDINNDL